MIITSFLCVLFQRNMYTVVSLFSESQFTQYLLYFCVSVWAENIKRVSWFIGQGCVSLRMKLNQLKFCLQFNFDVYFHYRSR